MNNYKELWYDWMGGNEVLFLGINSINDPTYRSIMEIISWFGRHEHFPAYLIITLIWILTRLFSKTIKNQNKWFYGTSWAGVLMMLIIGYGTVGLVTKELKDSLMYPRPYVVFPAAEYVVKDDPADKTEDFRSFPSGHVAFTTLMVVALWPVLNSFLAWGGVFFIALMGWSRVALGMHFPADVVATVLMFAPLLVVVRTFLYFMLRKCLGIKC